MTSPFVGERHRYYDNVSSQPVDGQTGRPSVLAFTPAQHNMLHTDRQMHDPNQPTEYVPKNTSHNLTQQLDTNGSDLNANADTSLAVINHSSSVHTDAMNINRQQPQQQQAQRQQHTHTQTQTQTQTPTPSQQQSTSPQPRSIHSPILQSAYRPPGLAQGKAQLGNTSNPSSFRSLPPPSIPLQSSSSSSTCAIAAASTSTSNRYMAVENGARVAASFPTSTSTSIHSSSRKPEATAASHTNFSHSHANDIHDLPSRQRSLSTADEHDQKITIMTNAFRTILECLGM